MLFRSQWTRGFAGNTLEQMLRAAEVPTSRVYTIADIYADPHFAARQMLQQVSHPTLGHTTQIGVVPRLSATPGAIHSSGPELGAHGAAILRDELHLSAERQQTLIQSGAVKVPSTT